MFSEMRKNLAMLREVNGVQSIVLTGRDGLLIEHIDVGVNINPDTTSALVAGMFGMIKQSILRIGDNEDFAKGEMKQLLLELSNSKVMAVGVKNWLLLVIATEEVNLGLLRIYLKKVAVNISSLMEEE